MALETQHEEMRGTAVMEPALSAALGPRAEALAAKPIHPIARLLPSLTDVAFLVPIVALFVRLDGAKTILRDGDTGWHIRTGEWILANGRVPHHDLFSYTKPGQPWFAWEWLWDLMFGWLHQHWGLAAVVLVSTVLLSGIFALVYRIARWKSQNAVVAIAVTMAALAGSSIHWLGRPHLFTWFFVALFFWILERAQSGRKRALLWLPALMVLWTNLHGGFLAGLTLVGAYAAGEFLSWAFETRSDLRAEALANSRRYAITTLACAAASLINPYGYKLHVHIVQYLLDRSQFSTIQEFLSYDFQHPMAKCVEVMILLGAGACIWSVYHRRFAYAILLLLWGHLGLFSARHLPIFLILSTPIIAACVADLLGPLGRADVAAWWRRRVAGFERLSAEVSAIEKVGRIPVFSVGVVLLLAVLLRLGPTDKFRAEFDPKDFPAGAISLLRQPQYASGVFTTDQWGDYLIYRLYPNFKAFIDGRSDFYGPLGTTYLNVVQGRWDWQKELDARRVNTVLLPVKFAVVSTLKESARWRVIYDDKTAIAFERVSQGAAAMPAAAQVAAVADGGFIAVARPQTLKPVVSVPQSYARRN